MAERASSPSRENVDKPYVPDFPRENFYLLFCVVLPFMIKRCGKYDTLCIDADSFAGMPKLAELLGGIFSFSASHFRRF